MDFIWPAKIYEINSNFQFINAIDELDKYRFSGREQILDIGCGDGKITESIAKKLSSGHITGIDSSQEMITLAKKRYQKNNKINFVIQDANQICCINKYDLIVSFACLHWIAKKYILLKKIYSALRENGTVLLDLYPKHENLWDPINEVTNSVKWKKYFNNFIDPHINYHIIDYKRLCSESGFKIINISEEIKYSYFDDIRQMMDFLISWLPHSERIPNELRDNYIYEICNKIILNNQNTFKVLSNKFMIPFKRIFCHLKKEYN